MQPPDKHSRLTDRLRDLLRKQYGGINDSFYGELDRIDAFAVPSHARAPESKLVTCPGCHKSVRYDAPACQDQPPRYGNACPLWEKGAGEALLARSTATGETPSHYQQQAAELEAMAERECSQRAKNAMRAAAHDLRELERELAAANDIILKHHEIAGPLISAPSSTRTPMPLDGAPRECFVAKGRVSGNWAHVVLRHPECGEWQRYVREDLAASAIAAPDKILCDAVADAARYEEVREVLLAGGAIRYDSGNQEWVIEDGRGNKTFTRALSAFLDERMASSRADGTANG